MNGQKIGCNCGNAIANDRWIAGISIAGGAALGAAIMYFWDLRRGRGRRAELQQKAASAVQAAGHKLTKKGEDLLNRAKGLVAEADAALECRGDTKDDDILAERVRSHLGHITAHAGVIQTEVVNGVAELRGTISPDKKRAVIDEVLAVLGVKGVRDLLVAA